MNRMLILAVVLLFTSAAFSAGLVPMERPPGAKDATDETGGRVIGFTYGVPANPITVYVHNPGKEYRAPDHNPLICDNKFQARSITSLEQWKPVAEQIRTAVKDYFGQPPKADIDLDAKVEKEEDRGDYTYRLVSYDFGYGHRARLGLLIPKGVPAPAPVIMVMDAWHEDAGKVIEKLVDGVYSRTWGVHLVRQGFIVAAVDHWNELFGKSNRFNTAGAACHNLGRAISYLETQKELVNPKQIGLFGHIYGAELAQFAAAVEPRFAAYAISNSWMKVVPPYDTDYWSPPFWASGFGFGEIIRLVERSNPEMYVSARPVSTNPLPFLTQEMVALMAPKPVLGINYGLWIDNKKQDLAVIENIRPVYELYDKNPPIEMIYHKMSTNIPPHARDHMIDFFLRAMCSINPGKCDEATSKTIVDELRSGDVARQQRAAWLASWHKCKPATEELVKLLDGKDVPLRHISAKALARIGAVNELFGHLKDEDPVVRMFAVEAIYVNGATEQQWAELAKQEKDKDKWVKECKWQTLQLNPYE